MAKGRPAKEDSQYTVHIHNNGGHKYASTNTYTIDDNGRRRYRYTHWGTIDDNKKFTPGVNFYHASIEERRKLVFPADWDLSAIGKKSQSEDRRGAVRYEAGDVDRQYGPTWLLDKVAEETGLKKDLMEVFEGNKEIVDQILTLAYYPFVDNLSYSHLSQWQLEAKAPTDVKMTPSVITRLTERITEKNRMDLFRLRAARIGKDELCGVDSTSISTYGFNLADIRWGHNKERLPLRQTLQVVVYSLTSHMPIFYLELPGNMPDSRTIEMILKELDHAGFKNLILITDRGYESLKNIELYIARGQRVLTSVKASQGDVLKLIKTIDMSRRAPSGMEYSRDERLFYMQRKVEYSVKGNGDNVIKANDMRINLYYSPKKEAEDVCRLHDTLQSMKDEVEEAIRTGEKISDRDAYDRAHKLLIIEYDGDRVKSYKENTDAIDNRLRTSGFFASKSIGLDLDPITAKDTYGMRDEQEKSFELQKGPLGQDRLRVWSEASKHGRMFICFIGLILASFVRHRRDTDEYLRKRFDSAESILQEMRTIRCIEHDGRRKFITPFVGDQVEICRAFGYDIPDGCAPKYTSKAKGTPKRGRPAKAKTETLET